MGDDALFLTIDTQKDYETGFKKALTDMQKASVYFDSQGFLAHLDTALRTSEHDHVGKRLDRLKTACYIVNNVS